jgi:hypothetical protein
MWDLISSHLITSLLVRLITRFSDFGISEKRIKEISEEYRKRKTVRFTTSRRELSASDKTLRRWHVSRVKTPQP